MVNHLALTFDIYPNRSLVPPEEINGGSRACSRCEEGLRFGSVSLDINRREEARESHATQTVAAKIDAHVLVGFCDECGSRDAYAETWRRQLLDRLFLSKPSPEDETVAKNTCRRCLGSLSAGGAHIIINLMVVQTETSAEIEEEVEFTCLFDEAGLSYCHGCAKFLLHGFLNEANEMLL